MKNATTSNRQNDTPTDAATELAVGWSCQPVHVPGGRTAVQFDQDRSGESFTLPLADLAHLLQAIETDEDDQALVELVERLTTGQDRS